MFTQWKFDARFELERLNDALSGAKSVGISNVLPDKR